MEAEASTGGQREVVFLQVDAYDAAGARVEVLAQIRHVVMQGQKWDRSDFFMLLPEAGTFDSPRTPAAASGAGFGGA